MPILIPRWSASLLLVSLLAACAKKPDTAVTSRPAAVELVQESERSPHFEAVDKHLELGGTLYGYADIDGDVLSVAAPAQAFMKQLAEAQPGFSMFAKQDFGALITTLGLDDVKAVGVSSVREASGYYRNRAFIYMPHGRHGFFAVFGGSPGPFVGTKMAPKDADYFGEFDFDLKAIYETTESIIAKVNGPEAAADFRKKVQGVGANSHFSLLDLVEGLKGRATIIVRFDPVKNVALPGMQKLTIPDFAMLVKVEGVGGAVEGAMKEDASKFDITTKGTMRVYAQKNAPDVGDFKVVEAFDGNALYVATTAAFLDECLTRKDGLDANPAFAAGLAALGSKGNGIAWVSPRFMSRLRELGSLNTAAEPQMHKFLNLYSSNIPEISQPLLSVRTNLPDGILMRSEWYRSLKADLAMLTVYNPVTIGVLAAMAIPAYQKVRLNAQTVAIQANLKMLALAADKYCLDNNLTHCAFNDIVGPDKPIKTVVSVAGEDYRYILFSKGKQVRVSLPDGRSVFYNPPGYHAGSFNQTQPLWNPYATNSAGSANQVQAPWNPFPTNIGNVNETAKNAVRENLRRLDAAATEYYKKNNTTIATYDQLVGPGKAIPAIVPVQGEDYRTILFGIGIPVRVWLGEGKGWVEYPQK